MTDKTPSSWTARLPLAGLSMTQEKIVFALAVALFAVFSFTLKDFASIDNLMGLLYNVSVLGVLGLAMALVVIGRGIDLSLIATMAISVAWSLTLIRTGTSIEMALLYGGLMALAIGVINGWLIAYAEIPALFCTLAMGTLVYGFGRIALIPADVVYMPADAGWFGALGQAEVLGIPAPVIVFLLFALLATGVLKYTRFGRYTYLMGDNYAAARITGVPTRPMLVMQYAITSLIGFVAGLVTAASVDSMNTRIVNSTMIYDVILVVVLGGIGLSGGKGGVRNVIVGTLLIGILLNGMTIMNIEYTVQNFIKGAILLAALIFDSFINPRDEQTAQQGDI